MDKQNNLKADLPRIDSSATLQQAFLRGQVQRQQSNNFHSSSLVTQHITGGKMPSQTVNKTSLHPSGVQYAHDLDIHKETGLTNHPIDLNMSTLSSRKSSTRKLISTTTVFLSYVPQHILSEDAHTNIC